MFYNQQSVDDRDQYKTYLTTIGSLSNLFSDSSTPYLYYRVAEKVFCDAFSATDLSRSDVSSDAAKAGLGIGLKTFLRSNNRTLQKVAEFNRERHSYGELRGVELVKEIGRLRNKRLKFTQNTYELTDAIYHCVVRSEGQFRIFEEPMVPVAIEQIGNVKEKANTVVFDDGISEYSFSLSKSTLLKRFNTTTFTDSFEVPILNNPLPDLVTWLREMQEVSIASPRIVATVYLPLYGRAGKVFERSGLNQWNARGRERHPNEVYIRIPRWIHAKFPDFFPGRDEPFDMVLPQGKVLRSKVCQAGDKALMSYSNRELGEWILRDVLNLPEGTLVTYSLLEDIGIDSVRVDKTVDGTFEINFASLGSFEIFEENCSG